jgi:hypothetical protein
MTRLEALARRLRCSVCNAVVRPSKGCELHPGSDYVLLAKGAPEPPQRQEEAEQLGLFEGKLAKGDDR